jgi:hypothetical protein
MTLDKNGFVASDLTTNTTTITTQLKSIYGDDIDVSSSSADGQLVNLMALAKTESQQIAEGVLATFDLDQAVGIYLDNIANIVGIQRKGGTYTLQEVSVVVNASVTLQGLDSNINNPDGTGFTIQDNNSNQFILANSVSLTTGTHNLIFRSKAIGAVATTPNTITNIVTITAGIDQETDINLRLRIKQSHSSSAVAVVPAIQANILNVSSVTDAIVLENDTNVIDSDGVAPHSIWAIVEGGADLDIANAIRYKLTPGTGTQGDVSVVIPLENRRSKIINFDRPTSQNLYVRFDIKAILSGQNFNLALIKKYIVDNISYNIFQSAETATLTLTAFNAINNSGGGGVPLALQISKNNSTWFDSLNPDNPKSKFILDEDNITITIL